MASVLHIFTAPGHGAPMVAHQQVMVHADTGIEGDRYFPAASRQGPDNQLTLIEIENIAAFNTAFGRTMSPDALEFFMGKAGLRTRVLEGGVLELGASIAGTATS